MTIEKSPMIPLINLREMSDTNTNPMTIVKKKLTTLLTY